MKKLMVAFAAVALAAGVQASQIYWGVGCMGISQGSGDAIFNYQGETGGVGFNGIGYLILSEEATAWDTQLGSDGTIGSLKAHGQAAAWGDGLPTDGDPDLGGFFLMDDATVSAGDHAFKMVFVEKVGDKTYWCVSDDLDATTVADASSDPQMALFDKATSRTADAGNWQSYGAAVPEPTSGLLLLLGVAGLALKRRRA